MEDKTTQVRSLLEYCAGVGIEEASEVLGVPAKKIKRWLEDSGSKPLKIPNNIFIRYYEHIVIPRIEKSVDSFGEKFKEYLNPDCAEWVGRDIRVLFPCYKTTNPATAWALVALALDYGEDRIQFDMECGDAVIENTRNKLASRFMTETTCTWSLWIDDDIVPPIGRAAWLKRICGFPSDYKDEHAGMRVLDRLLSHKQKIVSATYFARRATGPPVFAGGLFNEEYNKAARNFENKLIATDWVPTGCLLVHRDVYSAIEEKYPELSPEQNPMNRDREYDTVWWDYFRKFPGKGEDVSFCERAKACGFQPYVDTKLHAAHVGYCAYNASNTIDKRIEKKKASWL